MENNKFDTGLVEETDSLELPTNASPAVPTEGEYHQPEIKQRGREDAILEQWGLHHDAFDQALAFDPKRLQDYMMSKKPSGNPSYDAGYNEGCSAYFEFAKNPNKLYNEVLRIRKERNEPNILGRKR